MKIMKSISLASGIAAVVSVDDMRLVLKASPSRMSIVEVCRSMHCVAPDFLDRFPDKVEKWEDVHAILSTIGKLGIADDYYDTLGSDRKVVKLKLTPEDPNIQNPIPIWVTLDKTAVSTFWLADNTSVTYSEFFAVCTHGIRDIISTSRHVMAGINMPFVPSGASPHTILKSALEGLSDKGPDRRYRTIGGVCALMDGIPVGMLSDTRFMDDIPELHRRADLALSDALKVAVEHFPHVRCQEARVAVQNTAQSTIADKYRVLDFLRARLSRKSITVHQYVYDDTACATENTSEKV